MIRRVSGCFCGRGINSLPPKAAKTGEKIMSDISYEIRALYNGAFEPVEDNYRD